MVRPRGYCTGSMYQLNEQEPHARLSSRPESMTIYSTAVTPFIFTESRQKRKKRALTCQGRLYTSISFDIQTDPKQAETGTCSFCHNLPVSAN